MKKINNYEHFMHSFVYTEVVFPGIYPKYIVFEL